MKKFKDRFFNRKFTFVFSCFMILSLSILLCACQVPGINKVNDKSINDNVIGNNTDKNVTNADTKITFKRYYLKTKSSRTETLSVDTDKIGLNKEEFVNKYDGWNIEEFNSDAVIMAKEIDSYPEGYYKISVLKEDDTEYVAVYVFDKDGESYLSEKTQTPIELLDANTVSELRKGIIAENKDELYSLLQNYAE